MMDPRTATPQRSIWQPITETQFQQDTSVLWKATRGRPKDPQTYLLPISRTAEDKIFPIAVELQLANSIAFISANQKGVESVSAVAIERPQVPSHGLRLNLAANEEIHQVVKDSMNEIAGFLRQAAQEGRINSKVERLGLMAKIITRKDQRSMQR